MRCLTLTITCLLLTAPALLGAGDAPDDSAVYERAVRSTVWIYSSDLEATRVSFGSGVLIDAKQGWLLTAYHVVEDREILCTFLPIPDTAGGLVTDPDYYWQHYRRVGDPGVVVARDATRDLALIKVRPLPLLRSVPLAALPARPGQPLIAIGNSVSRRDGKMVGVAYRYAGGNVRQVYDRRCRFPSGQEIAAKVVECTVPLNPGDSGGPIFNRGGELVAISSAIVADQNQVQFGIDVSEIRAFLKANKLELSKEPDGKP